MLKTSVRFPAVSRDFVDGAEYCHTPYNTPNERVAHFFALLLAVAGDTADGNVEVEKTISGPNVLP